MTSMNTLSPANDTSDIPASPPAPLSNKQTEELELITASGDQELISGTAFESVAAAIETKSIIGRDDRIEIGTPDQYPWSMICELELETSDSHTGRGTGWLIDAQTVITAAHCLYNHQFGGWTKRVFVTPGGSVDNEFYPTIESNNFSLPRQWHQERDREFDFAAIHLPFEVTPYPGNFAVKSISDHLLLDQLVNIAGYPADQPVGTLWNDRNRLLDVEAQRLIYDTDTEAGQSGSPVVMFPPDRTLPPTVIGIHAYGTNSIDRLNSGVRINANVLSYFNTWRRNPS